MKRTIRLNAIPATVASLLVFAAPLAVHATSINYVTVGPTSSFSGPPNTLFPAYSGTGAAPDPGTYWNPVAANGTTSGDKLSDGATNSLITLSETEQGQYIDGTSVTNAPNAFFAQPFAYNGAGGVGIQTNTLTLNNVASGVYDLYLYGMNGGYHSNSTTFTVTGYGAQSTTNTAASGFNLGDNFVVFSGVSPDGGGQIQVSWTASGTNGNEGDFNGLQLVSVPEPSTQVLAGLAGLGLLGMAWRRRTPRSA